VIGVRSCDIILGNFSHMVLVLRAMFGMSSNRGLYLHCSLEWSSSDWKSH